MNRAAIGPDSDSDSGTANRGLKCRHDQEDDDSEDEGNPSKKAKTGNQPSSHRPAGESDDDRDPDAQRKNDGQSSTPPVNASFDSQATLEDETVEIRIGQEIYPFNASDNPILIPWDESREDWPDNFDAFPDFAFIGQPFNTWCRASREWLGPQLEGRGERRNKIIAQALLHMKFKKTFLHEKDENFSLVWVNDRTVFDTNKEDLLAIVDPALRNGGIRQRMMEAYDPEMLRRIEALPKPRPVNFKTTVQKGTFEDLESFNSDVYPSEKDSNGGKRRRVWMR